MWTTVEEFAEWYKSEGFPIRPPFEDPIYITEISYSYVLYREGQYQAELYLIKPTSFLNLLLRRRAVQIWNRRILIGELSSWVKVSFKNISKYRLDSLSVI